MAQLLGVGECWRGNGGASRAAPSHGAAKEKDGARASGGQGKKGLSKGSRTAAGEGGDGGTRKRSRGAAAVAAAAGSASSATSNANAATAAANAAAAVSASVAMSSGSSKAAGDTARAVFRTPSEGLTRLNVILRTPSLAVLASVLQLTTVSARAEYNRVYT